MTIAEVNTVRKHVSSIIGGRLLRWTGDAEVLSLLVSDMILDDPESIAPGQTAPDHTTFADIRDMPER